MYLQAFHTGLVGFFVVGTGLGIGGMIAYLLSNIKGVLVSLLASAASGIIFSFIVLDILPESVGMGGMAVTLTAIFLGMTFARRLDHLSDHVIIFSLRPKVDRVLQYGSLLAVAIAIHNFPSGVALGASLLTSQGLALHLAITMMVHSIPEGLVMGLTLSQSNIIPLFFLSSSVAIPSGIGALVGYGFGQMAPWVLSIVLGIAMGTILYVCSFEMLHPSWRRWGAYKTGMGFLIGGLIGIMFLKMVDVIL